MPRFRLPSSSEYCNHYLLGLLGYMRNFLDASKRIGARQLQCHPAPLTAWKARQAKYETEAIENDPEKREEEISLKIGASL